MRFMVMVKATKDSEAGVMPSEELLGAMGKFNEELVKAGVMLDGNGLQPSSKGARVRFSGDKRTVIDGPFAETKELVAGYWIIQVQVAGRGRRVDEALPQSAQRGWRDRDPPALRARRLRRQRSRSTSTATSPSKLAREVNLAPVEAWSQSQPLRLSQPREGDDDAIHVDGEIFRGSPPGAAAAGADGGDGQARRRR